MSQIYYIQILLFALIIFANVSFAQMKLHDNYAGLSVSSEIDNEVMSFNMNYEHELIKTGRNLIGIGASVKHLNWGSTLSGNVFVSGQVNYNFANIGDRELVPFVGVMFGTNINYKKKYYIGQAGLRYFTEKNLTMIMKYGIGNRSYVVAEVGVEYRF